MIALGKQQDDGLPSASMSVNGDAASISISA